MSQSAAQQKAPGQQCCAQDSRVIVDRDHQGSHGIIFFEHCCRTYPRKMIVVRIEDISSLASSEECLVRRSRWAGNLSCRQKQTEGKGFAPRFHL
jgi:hypothetical protein